MHPGIPTTDTMPPLLDRRRFLGGSMTVSSVAALSWLLGRDLPAAVPALSAVHVPARAKRVIYLFQSGGPSHLELLDPKPELQSRQGTELPDSVRMGQRLTGMTSGQKSFPVVASKFGFRPCGQSGIAMSELLPHTEQQPSRFGGQPRRKFVIAHSPGSSIPMTCSASSAALPSGVNRRSGFLENSIC